MHALAGNVTCKASLPIRSWQGSNLSLIIATTLHHRKELVEPIMERVSAPINRAKALVCARCWTKCFDTEGFERLGRREIMNFTYDVSVCGLRSTDDIVSHLLPKTCHSLHDAVISSCRYTY
jgi:hypothetical protein